MIQREYYILNSNRIKMYSDTAFVPPIIYAIFGSSRHVAVGPIASCSMIVYQNISSVVSPDENPVLYLHLVFTACFVTGVFQAALGVLRSHYFTKH